MDTTLPIDDKTTTLFNSIASRVLDELEKIDYDLGADAILASGIDKTSFTEEELPYVDGVMLYYLNSGW